MDNDAWSTLYRATKQASSYHVSTGTNDDPLSQEGTQNKQIKNTKTTWKKWQTNQHATISPFHPNKSTHWKWNQQQQQQRKKDKRIFMVENDFPIWSFWFSLSRHCLEKLFPQRVWCCCSCYLDKHFLYPWKIAMISIPLTAAAAAAHAPHVDEAIFRAVRILDRWHLQSRQYNGWQWKTKKITNRRMDLFNPFTIFLIVVVVVVGSL